MPDEKSWSTTMEALIPTMQPFMKVGQAMAQQFFNYLSSQQAHHTFGGSPIYVKPLDPAKLEDLQRHFLSQQMLLWQSFLTPKTEGEESFKVSPKPGDKRFSAPEWHESAPFSYLQQNYLLLSDFIRDLIEIADTETDVCKERLRFLARQYIDAISPTNFAATNPEFIRYAVETKGKSITDGINNLIGDMAKGSISMTDESAFDVGTNIAVAPGSVVFENELIQLIQYDPITPKVAKRPLVIVPPCINKFYILDLQPENSFVRYATETGNTVFLVSWRNPHEEQGNLTWEDYLIHGAVTALAVAREISGEEKVNALGFCVGGTILSSALGVLAARGEKWVESLTLLTTFLDFSIPGEIGLFIDEYACQKREASIGNGGIMPGHELATTFSALRANDLIWNYVSGNYLKGQKPPAFDLLYWNGDATNLPGPFACWYMRNLYLDNALRIPRKLEMCGVKVDLGKIGVPNYLYASREDHIVPWLSAYLSTRVLKGKTRFVLGASGHIAGVINPASKNRRSYWTNDDLSGDAETWFSSAAEHKGSWWSDWAQWLAQFSGGEKPAPKTPGNAKYKPIEPAPGRYVKEKA